MRFSQASIACLCGASILAPFVGAQEPLTRVSSQLVEVDVVVHKGTGVVDGLQKGDFTVLDRGKPQNIASFRVERRAEQEQAKPLKPFEFSNRMGRDGLVPKGQTILLIDMMNTAVERQSEVRRQIARYLQERGNDERFALYTMSKTLNVLQDFTDDPARLMRRVVKYSPEASLDLQTPDLLSDLHITDLSAPGDAAGAAAAALSDSMLQNAIAETGDNAHLRRAETTSAGLVAIAKHLAGIPGRKKLLWFTEAFPARVVEQRTRVGAAQIEDLDYVKYIDKAVQALNDANVAVFPVDPRDTVNGGLLVEGLDTMDLIAGRTGGEPQYLMNDLAQAMRKVVDDDSVVYVLGFYSSAKLDGSYHDVTVKVARDGVNVRNRKGYFALEAVLPAKAKKYDAISELFTGPLEATRLGIDASVRPIDTKGSVYRVQLKILPEELQLTRETDKKGTAYWTGLIQLATMGSWAYMPNGSTEDIKLSFTEPRLKEVLRDGLTLTRNVVVPERAELRIAVRDRNTGAVGSVRVPLPEPAAATQLP